MVRINTERIWDLSQPVAHDGPAWAQYDPPTITRNYRRAAEGFNAETVRMNTHTGTHVDVPFHFFDDGASIERMPLTAFAGPARFLDLRDGLEPDAPIPAARLAPQLRDLQPGDIAVLATGWGERRAISEEFLKYWPYLNGEGARLLLDHDVAGVGTDALSIGGGGSPQKGKPPHQVLLSAGKFIIEDMRVPGDIIGRRCYLAAFPILLHGCGGAWTRAVAWELG